MAIVYLLREKKKNLSWILRTSIFSLKFNHNFSPPLTILSNLPQVPFHSDTFRKAFGKMFKKKCWNIRYIIIVSQLGQLEKEMATHSSVPAWRIPGVAEPGGLPSMGSHRVGHNWSDLAAAAAGVSETILSSFQSFYFILLFRNYFHHFIFWLTDSLFCFRYSATDSFYF